MRSSLFNHFFFIHFMCVFSFVDIVCVIGCCYGNCLHCIHTCTDILSLHAPISIKHSFALREFIVLQKNIPLYIQLGSIKIFIHQPHPYHTFHTHQFCFLISKFNHLWLVRYKFNVQRFCAIRVKISTAFKKGIHSSTCINCVYMTRMRDIFCVYNIFIQAKEI